MSLLAVLLSEDDPLDCALLDAGFAIHEGPAGEWTRGRVRYVIERARRARRHLLRIDGRQPSWLEPGFAAAVTSSGVVADLEAVGLQIAGSFAREVASPMPARGAAGRELGDVYRAATPFAPSIAWLRHAIARHRGAVRGPAAEWAVAATTERVSVMLAIEAADPADAAVLRDAAQMLEAFLDECSAR